MDGRSQRHDWLASRPTRFFKKKADARRAGWMDPARPLFGKIWPAGWPANHVFGFPHSFQGYIIGIGILLDIFSLLWVVFLLSWVGLSNAYTNQILFWWGHSKPSLLLVKALSAGDPSLLQGSLVQVHEIYTAFAQPNK